MCQAIAPLHNLTTQFLGISSAKWERRQAATAASGGRRSYIVLEAAQGQQVGACMLECLALVCQDVPGTGPGEATCSQRTLRFGMLFGALCALHVLLRVPRRSMPYAMFQLLSDESKAESLFQIPDCLADPLWLSLKKRYQTPQALLSAEGRAVLETLAALISVDVASIEAGHSMTREFTHLRSRGWFPSLESVASKWCLQQNLRF